MITFIIKGSLTIIIIHYFFKCQIKVMYNISGIYALSIEPNLFLHVILFVL